MKMLPDGFVQTSLAALDTEETPQFLSAFCEGEAARGMRLRPGMNIGAIRRVLPGAYEAIPWAQNAYYIEKESCAGSHPFHAAGAYYLQEPSAMAAVAALDVKPGETVLDLCAAPGGKSTQIGGLLCGRGTLISNEIVPSRAKILSQNIERMGIANCVVVNEQPGRLAEKWGAWFDCVLVDAPCSGEGMFRKEPGAMEEWTPEGPEGCAARQRQILASAAQLLKPGGRIVYSTCTFNTIENEGVVQAFLQEHDDFYAEDFALEGVGKSRNGMLRLWPHKLRGEGHFVARFRRRGEAEMDANKEKPHVCLGEWLDLFSNLSIEGNVVRAGTKVWVYPPNAPELAGIRALRTGLAIGEQRGKVFVPDHAVALAFSAGCFHSVLPANDEQAERYLRGETLTVEGIPNGWLVVSYAGMGLGLGKCVDGVVKNHLPKGLRRLR